MNCPGSRRNWSGTEGRARLGWTWDRPRRSVATVRQGRGRAFGIVAAHVQVLVGGAALPVPMNRLRIAVDVAATGPQPRFEEHSHASQISINVSNGSSQLPMSSSVGLRVLQTMNADGTAATARLVQNGQARRAMLVKFPARFFHRLARTATGRHGSHDRFDAHV